jgi:UDP-2,4-diacetamido-2,4,6-trideoxy-beta-L-altropyranose hydrolase
MDTSLLIRVDASAKIGSGHLMRCLAIADYLKSRGIQAQFLSRSKHLGDHVRGKGFKAHVLAQDCPLEEELHKTRGLASELGIGIMILDVNNYDSYRGLSTYNEYLKGLKDQSLFLISFEDFKVHPAIADRVVIPYAGADRLCLPQGNNCRYLLGPRYFVLREDFLKGKHAIIRSKVHRILISMGGCDVERITLKVLHSLSNGKIDVRLEIVMGDLCPIEDGELQDALGQYNGAYSIARGIGDMAAAMAKSDIAIINSGLTKYETAAVGLPSIVISNGAYHAEMMVPFAEYGTSLHLGAVNDVKEGDISEAVVHLIDNKEQRRRMAVAGRRLMDGGGIARILAEIPTHLIQL